MKITEIRVKLIDDRVDNRLRAFCSITLDDSFVVRDLKIIDGTKGLFIAMPSRKLTDRCRRCSYKNNLRARYCNDCGDLLNDNRAAVDDNGRAKLHADIAHPINAECRDMIQRVVVAAYHEERALSKLPGYTCTYDDPVDDGLVHDRPHRPVN